LLVDRFTGEGAETPQVEGQTPWPTGLCVIEEAKKKKDEEEQRRKEEEEEKQRLLEQQQQYEL